MEKVFEIPSVFNKKQNKTEQNLQTTLRYNLVKFKTHRTKKIVKPFGEKKRGHLKGMKTTLASMESRRS